jgi:hypothetical protein
MLTGKGMIFSTAKTPEIVLNSEGIIRIKGRWMMENSAPFAKELSDWYDAYIFEQSDINAIDVRLEYFSSFNLGILISLLRKIIFSQLILGNLAVNWYYEEGDEDIMDLGEYISSVLGIQFNFVMISEKKLIRSSGVQIKNAI